MLTPKNSRMCRSLLCAFFSAVILLYSLSACNAEGQESSAVSHASAGAGRAVSSAPLTGDEEITVLKNLESAAESVYTEGDSLLLKAQTPAAAPIYEAPAPGEPIAQTEAGETFILTETADPLWYSVTLENGAVGYLYGESLFRINEEGNVSAKSIFLETTEEKLASLREQLPEGKYWNHMDQDLPYGEETPFSVTDIPCEHSTYGELYCNFYNGATEAFFPYDTLCQCLGFASLLSDQLFGTEASLHLFYNYARLRVGDHIRLGEYEHSMTVIEKAEDYITVAEVNEDYEDCLISWSRQISYYELEELHWDSEYISRYPFYIDEDGAFVPWDDDFSGYDD